MKDQLIQFFDTVKSTDTVDKTFFHLRNNLAWIVLIDENRLGITEQGDWIVETPSNMFILNNKKSFLYAMSMLEMPFEQIKVKINERFGNIMNSYKIEDIFPFYDIVYFVFTERYNDYWFCLALQWCKNMDYHRKVGLAEILEQVLSKKIPQKTMHSARKELKLIKKYISENKL